MHHPDFGPNVLVFDPSMPTAAVQAELDRVYALQQNSQFGGGRFALLFRPGAYDVDINVGFYTQVAGLGASPDDVSITNNLHSDAYLPQDNATCNFWRGVENFSVAPRSGTVKWAVAQATPFRRMHVRGSLALSQGHGWSSGGFIADSVIDGTVHNGSQQQWLTRHSRLGRWEGHNWNAVFVGVEGAPSGGGWPDPPYTVIDQAPVVPEKPFLTLDATGEYHVRSSGTAFPLSEFHVARADRDTAATLNAALAAGRHLLLTPGIYQLEDTLRVDRAGTVVLGLGFATLVPQNGVVGMKVADVDGVVLAGLLFDAGPTNSPALLEGGTPGCTARHRDRPTRLHDVFFRVGGAVAGRASVSVVLHSHDVIGDHFWVWRADHGDEGTVGWTLNAAANGLVVNGDDVTIYGLFVEHYQEYQTLWNGDGGRVYFYQSEIPYDPPTQDQWKNGAVNGYASYKVAEGVTRHEAWGLGIYCFFRENPAVKLAHAIEAPEGPGVRFHNITTVSLGGTGEITAVLNGRGDAVNRGHLVARLQE